jgi:hypothetical protein
MPYIVRTRRIPLLIKALAIQFLLCWQVDITTAATTYTLGPAQTIYQDSPFYLDLPVTTISDGKGGFYFYHCRGAGGPNHKTHGTLSDPFNPVVWDKSFSSLWDTNGYDPGGRYTVQWWSPWIMNIYKVTSTEWISFCHIEKSPNTRWGPSNSVQNFSAGIGYSNNSGESWTFCGETICLFEDPTGGNIGAAAVAKVNDGGTDYFYHYYNDIDETAPLDPKVDSTGRGTAVARAKVDDVIAAARNKSVGTWHKYYNGTWAEYGWRGAATIILPGIDSHSDIHYNRALRKYLFVGNRFARRSPTKRSEIVLYESTDGLVWSNEKVVASTSSPGESLYYSWFAGTGSDDGYEIDGNCSLYWMQRGRGGDAKQRTSRLDRCEITIVSDAPSATVK